MAVKPSHRYGVEHWIDVEVVVSTRKTRSRHEGDFKMGRGILLWLLGIPLPIVILLILFMR
jgi:hypothetical protein